MANLQFGWKPLQAAGALSKRQPFLFVKSYGSKMRANGHCLR
jgi:hypothetical protein